MVSKEKTAWAPEEDETNFFYEGDQIRNSGKERKPLLNSARREINSKANPSNDALSQAELLTSGQFVAFGHP